MVDMLYKLFYIILVSMFIIFFPGCEDIRDNTLQSNIMKNDIVKVEFFKDSTILGALNVVLAETPKQRFQGLRDVKYLPENHGMLFLFSEEQELTFVMGQVFIPLDIIFVDKDLKIMNIHKANACDKTDNECGHYRSRGKAFYVVETNQGWSERRGIKVGDKIRILNFEF